jgi:hypothetical protein
MDPPALGLRPAHRLGVHPHGAPSAVREALATGRSTLGFAELPDLFMTCPTRNPRTPSLPPLNCSTGPGCSAIASSTHASSAEVSVTWRRPRASTIASAGSPVSKAISSTCFAPVAETVPSATR